MKNGKQSSSLKSVPVSQKMKSEANKVVYCPSWKSGYPWLVTVEQYDGLVTGIVPILF